MFELESVDPTLLVAVALVIAAGLGVIALMAVRSGLASLPSRTKTVLHCMVDLETLSLSTDAYIRSIGAAFFDASGVGQKFYASCDGPGQAGSHVDDKTVLWWGQQTEQARAALANHDGVTLPDALKEFSAWIFETRSWIAKHTGIPIDDVDVWVWGNGADFDPVILASAYRRSGMSPPWRWYNVRCYRTMKRVFHRVRQAPFDGEKHTALADAIHQAQHASEILRQIRT